MIQVNLKYNGYNVKLNCNTFNVDDKNITIMFNEDTKDSLDTFLKYLQACDKHFEVKFEGSNKTFTIPRSNFDVCLAPTFELHTNNTFMQALVKRDKQICEFRTELGKAFDRIVYAQKDLNVAKGINANIEDLLSRALDNFNVLKAELNLKAARDIFNKAKYLYEKLLDCRIKVDEVVFHYGLKDLCIKEEFIRLRAFQMYLAYVTRLKDDDTKFLEYMDLAMKAIATFEQINWCKNYIDKNKKRFNNVIKFRKKNIDFDAWCCNMEEEAEREYKVIEYNEDKKRMIESRNLSGAS